MEWVEHGFWSKDKGRSVHAWTHYNGGVRHTLQTHTGPSPFPTKAADCNLCNQHLGASSRAGGSVKP